MYVLSIKVPIQKNLETYLMIFLYIYANEKILKEKVLNKPAEKQSRYTTSH